MSDRRVALRKVFGPPWPLAYELALVGTPIGVFLDPVGGEWRAVAVDDNGELWELRRLRRAYLVRWCLNRNLRVYRNLSELVEALRGGFVVGWLHGRIVGCKGPVSWAFAAVRYVRPLLQEELFL